MVNRLLKFKFNKLKEFKNTYIYNLRPVYDNNKIIFIFDELFQILDKDIVLL